MIGSLKKQRRSIKEAPSETTKPKKAKLEMNENSQLQQELPPSVRIVRENDVLVWLDVRDFVSKKKSVPEIRPEDFLTRFLYPMKSEQFFLDHVLHKRALAITGFGRKRVDTLVEEFICNGEVSRLVRETASDDGVSVWIPNTSAGEGGAIESFKVADPQLSESLFKNAGASLYMRAPKRSCEQLTKGAFKSLQMPFCTYPSDGASRGEVEVFLASKQSKRTPTHTDFQENFTVQLRGKKTWRVRSGDVANPLRAKSPHFANTPMSVIETQLLASQVCSGSSVMDPPTDDDPRWEKVELDEGDILYHPPGIWHNVQTTGVSSASSSADDQGEQICLSINVSLVTPTWADIISQAIRQCLWQTPMLRQPVSLRDVPRIFTGNTLQSELIKAVRLLEKPDALIPPEIRTRINSPAIPNQNGTADDEEHDDENENKEEDGEDSIVIEFSTEPQEKRNWIATTRFTRNPLALMIFDSDASNDFDEEEEDDGEESTFDAIVHVNIGSPDLESLARFELMNIPLELKGFFKQQMRDTSLTAIWTGTDLETALSDYFIGVVDMLVRCGFLLVEA